MFYLKAWVLLMILYLGVLKAIQNVNEIIGPQFIAAKIDPKNQEAVDSFLLKLDGTSSKCNY